MLAGVIWRWENAVKKGELKDVENTKEKEKYKEKLNVIRTK
jgi:hypothetical protein